jgi:hypothetical protein
MSLIGFLFYAVACLQVPLIALTFLVGIHLTIKLPNIRLAGYPANLKSAGFFTLIC